MSERKIYHAPRSAYQTPHPPFYEKPKCGNVGSQYRALLALQN